MTLRSIRFKHVAAVAGATLMISLFAYAAPETGSMTDHCAAPMSDIGHQHEGMQGHGPEHGPGPMGMPPLEDDFMQGMPPLPFLHDLNLSEAQQDKIFAIQHNSAPLLREQGKLVRKSGDAIRELTDSTNYDEGKLKSLADSHARAITEIEVIHARSMHQILSLLTPEQRKQADAMKAKFDQHHMMRDQIRDIGTRPDSGSGSIAQ
jgi:protein CpxP